MKETLIFVLVAFLIHIVDVGCVGPQSAGPYSSLKILVKL